jgi:DNA-binding winged helix-turn-helix (wHTH) protein
MLTDKSLFRFEGCEVDPSSRSLSRNGQPVSLNPKTFDLLLYLVEHPQQLVTKEELLVAVWPGAFVEEGNLSQHVFLLRKALSGIKVDGQAVVTVPGRGYQFAKGVEQVPWRSRLQPAGDLVLHTVQSVMRVVVEEESDDETPAVTAGSKRRISWVWVGVAAAVLVLASGSILEWRRLHPAPAGHIDLVLSDFENSTGEPNFDRALNQALVIDLEQSPFLNLLSRSRIQETLTEMQRGKNEALTPALAMEIRERTNAQAMLHGTVAKLGTQYLLN